MKTLEIRFLSGTDKTFGFSLSCHYQYRTIYVPDTLSYEGIERKVFCTTFYLLFFSLSLVIPVSKWNWDNE